MAVVASESRSVLVQRGYDKNSYFYVMALYDLEVFSRDSLK